jgi:hypothetical protein
MSRNRERVKPFPKPARFALLAVLVVVGITAPELRAADGPPVVAKTDGKAPVTVTDNGKTFTLANGIVTATINKRNGDLDSLVFKGLETMGHEQGRSGYWEQDPSAAAKVDGLTQSVTIDPTKNGGARGEVSIRGITKGEP